MAQLALQPLPYLLAIRDYLKAHERDVWNWFASDVSSQQRAESVRLEILKTTYRLDRAENEEIYTHADRAARHLELDVPVTIYQSQNVDSPASAAPTSSGLNASIAFLPDEVHIILHGDVAARLSAEEQLALLGHELSHFVLWRKWDGEFYLVHQILSAMCNDPSAHAAHFATHRLFSLYNEIFCDRGACSVVDSAETVVSMLVKVQTNLERVSGASYIRQAEEIYAQGVTRTKEISHPEAFIRARAMQFWANQDPDVETKIQQMIEGSLSLQELDLLAQQKAAAITRCLIDVFLHPRELQSESMLAFARAFFADYQPTDTPLTENSVVEDARTTDVPMQDYYCYLLLDFVTADRDLEELPLASALRVSEQLGLKSRFIDLARKELRMRKKQMERIDKEKENILSNVAATAKNA